VWKLFFLEGAVVADDGNDVDGFEFLLEEV